MNCVALVVAFLSFNGVLATRIILSPEGGYSEIVVGIDKEIDEDEHVIQQIKALMTNASRDLYLATRGSVFFEDITIAIPSSWSHKPEYESSLKNNLKDADVVVSSDFSDDPVTVQPGGCGEPGLNIQLSPNYLRYMRRKSNVDRFGIPGKRFLQEWAKLRYGVFEEFVTEKMEKDRRFARYFDDNGHKIPATCPLSLGEWAFFVDKRKQPCDPNQGTEGCYFTVANDYVSVNTSIMYSASFDSIFTFCDEHNHNRRAMNKHNLLCNYKSTWEVVSSHADFKISPIQSMVRPRNTAPTFRFVRTLKDNGKTVLVLDISGSMGFFNGAPIKLLHQTASSHITEFVPDGSHLGIVVFGTNSKMVHPIVKVDNTTRKSLADKIPTLADGGGTAIGKGLLSGLELLKSSGVAEGGVLLLITDGEENEAPFIDDVTESLLDERVIVSVIAYGEKADKKLEALALETGGRASIFREINNTEAKTQSLQDTILQASTAQADINFEPVRLKSQPIILDSLETRDTFFLDHELGKNTIFYFQWTYNASPEVELISPSGIHYNWQSQGTYYTKEKNRIRFKFTDAETGPWTLIIRKQQNENPDISVTLTSEPKDAKKQPVRVKSWTSSVEVDPKANMNFVRIYARVTKKDIAVLNASVVGIITGPNGNKKISLKDDGTGVDSSADDGIYTGVATLDTFSGNGRYSVRARVSGRSKAVLKTKRKYRGNKKSRGKRSSDVGFDWNTDVLEEEDEGEDEDEDYVDEEYEEVMGDFERDEEAGTIIVSNWTPNPKDVTAPNRVVDLQLVNVTWAGDEKLITISWTEAGDDLTDGNATSIDIRCSLSFDNLLTFFDAQLKVDNTLLVDGNASPGASGQLRQTTFRIPREYLLSGSDDISLDGFLDRDADGQEEANQTFVGLRYADDEGNQAEVSNIISVSFIKPEDICKRKGNKKCAEVNAECLILEANSERYTCNCSAGLVYGDDGVCTDVCNATGSRECLKLNANCVIDQQDNTTFNCKCFPGLSPNELDFCLDACEATGDSECEDIKAVCVLDEFHNDTYHCVCPLGLSKHDNGICSDICVTAGEKACSELNAYCVINRTDVFAFGCDCLPGLSFDTSGRCSDVCQIEGNEQCATKNAQCLIDDLHNTTFSCDCQLGLAFNSDGVCSDICQLEGAATCVESNAYCVVNESNNATYNCVCPLGLSFNDAHTCSNVCEIEGNEICGQSNAYCDIDDGDNTTFNCLCYHGYFFDGLGNCVDKCQLQGNEQCSKSNALCVIDEPSNDTFRCLCPAGLAFDLNNNCVDVCQLEGDDTCSEYHALCVINELDNSTFSCNCPAGLSFNSEGTCWDICQLEGGDVCLKSNALCVINELDNSTFTCECPSGLFFDSQGNCVDICQMEGIEVCVEQEAVCQIQESDNSTYECECPSALEFNDEGICSDVCEIRGSDQCSETNSICVVNDKDNATYLCQCIDGHSPDSQGVCADACQVTGKEACGKLNSLCIIDSLDNTTYYCQCPFGLSEDDEGICADVCVTEGNQFCESLNAQCAIDEDNNSSYVCQCPPDLAKDANGVCSDSCTLNGNEFCNKSNALCVADDDRSKFTCTCTYGLSFDTDGFCSDICQVKGTEVCSKTNSHCQISDTDPETFDCICAVGEFKSNESGVCVDACENAGNQICDRLRARCLVHPLDNTTFACECPTGLFKDVNSFCTDICTAKGNQVCSQLNAKCLLDKHDPSNFTCKCRGKYADGPDGVCIEKEINVRIYDKNQTVEQGQNVVFYCRDEGKRRSRVRWYRKDGRPMPSLSSDHHGYLVIRSAQPRDGGIYLCSALNSVPFRKGSRKRAILRIKPLGCNSLQYQCKSGQCIDYRRRCDGAKDCLDLSDESNCPPNNVEVEELGEPAYLSSRLVDNNVNKIPDVDLKIYHETQTINQGFTAIFRCRDEGRERNSVQWSKEDNRALPYGATVTKGELRIPNVQLSDGGIYVCSIAGPLRPTSGSRKVAHLIVEPCIGSFCPRRVRK